MYDFIIFIVFSNLLKGLGGFTALFTASELPQLVRGLVLLNTAGQFRDSNINPVISNEESAKNKYLFNPVKLTFQRVFLGILFWQAKQPFRFKSVLKSVYINTSNVDDYLVESITIPAGDPNAGEVYYRLMTRFMIDQSNYNLDRILQKLSCHCCCYGVIWTPGYLNSFVKELGHRKYVLTTMLVLRKPCPESVLQSTSKGEFFYKSCGIRTRI
ncbi:hypothetical protein KFK09_028327 [Dendrobium nobile]|uniref:Uncharacterized protein n=1 Tax=Dendrobium nobile TaxID=94219 RepID=A0A8T3A749_DENNO|nr:hypothetical protein KFK09_028327 [Dendrobium nobile]